VLVVFLPITNNGVLLLRMWLAYASTITLWILTLRALWLIRSEQATMQRHISRWEDGIHLLGGCSTMGMVGGFFSDTLEGGWRGDNMEIFGEVLGLCLVFCLFYYYIIHIHPWRAVLRVHDGGINPWDVGFWERYSGSNRTPCMAIMYLVVRYLYPADVSPND